MFKVKKQCCDQCLFSKYKIVSNKRRQEILNSCRSNDNHFICHKATIKKEDICCRAFYDTQDSQMIKIAQRLGMVEFVS